MRCLKPPPAAAGAAAALRGVNLGGSFCVVPSGAPGMSSAASSVVGGGTGGRRRPAVRLDRARRRRRGARISRRRTRSSSWSRICSSASRRSAPRMAASRARAPRCARRRRTCRRRSPRCSGAPPSRRGSRRIIVSVLREQCTPRRAPTSPTPPRRSASLRAQLEAAHGAHRQQAALVLKYEQRWAQQASARGQAGAAGAGGGEAVVRLECVACLKVHRVARTCCMPGPRCSHEGNACVARELFDRAEARRCWRVKRT